MAYSKITLPARDLSALFESLGSLSDKPERLFALVNVADLDETRILEILPWAATGSETINLYSDLGNSGLIKLGPRLFELSDDPTAQQHLLELALNTRSVALLWSQAPQQVLAEHLQNMREVSLADGKAALFRFQDTKVASALFPVLPLSQHDILLGPLRRWVVIGPCCELHALEHVPSTESATTLAFDKATTRALDEALFEHTIEAQIDETDSSLLLQLTYCQRHQRINRYLQDARARGLTKSADLSLYCILAFQLPEGFDKRAPFARALHFKENGFATFGAALDAVVPEEWTIWDDHLNK